MWPTIFVIDNKETRLQKDLPPMSKGGEILLYLQDQFDGTQVPKAYTVDRIIFDVFSTKQYVYLTEQER